MPKGSAKKAGCLVAPNATPQAELQRHIAALKLSNTSEYQAWCRAQGFGSGLHKNWRQRREEVQRAERLEAHAHACAARNRHLHALGIESVADYEAWCRRHDFSLSLRKSEAQLAQERQTAERERAAQALTAWRRLNHKPEDMIRAIYEKQVSWNALRNASQAKIHQLFASVKEKPRTREVLLNLLLHVSSRTDLLTVEPAIPYLGPQPGNTYLDALLQLALRHRQWLRALEDWKPESHNTRRQFGSLARHLLACYDVPAFMDAAWFEGENATARQHQDWFLYIANGQNIRTTIDLPVALTKKAAHHFLKAPRDFSIVGALRWGQAHGMGGDEYLARAVAGSRLAEILPDEPFWATVIQFFVNSPMLDAAQIGPMADYLYHQKFVPQDILGPNGQVEHTGPPEPDLSMKGRTAAALQRRVEEWHRQLARETKRPPREWMRSGIGEFRLLQRDASTRETALCWTIQELLSSKELQEEGRAMHNCVATYADSCARGGCSIWALRLSIAHEAARRHIMTIEVDNQARAIVQARGPCNTIPSDRRASARLQMGVEMLRRWAEQEKLTIARYVW